MVHFSGESESNSVLKWSTQNHASRIKKVDTRSCVWLGLSLTNLHLPESVLIVAHMKLTSKLVLCRRVRGVKKGSLSRSHHTLFSAVYALHPIPTFFRL